MCEDEMNEDAYKRTGIGRGTHLQIDAHAATVNHHFSTPHTANTTTSPEWSGFTRTMSACSKLTPSIHLTTTIMLVLLSISQPTMALQSLWLLPTFFACLSISLCVRQYYPTPRVYRTAHKHGPCEGSMGCEPHTSGTPLHCSPQAAPLTIK